MLNENKVILNVPCEVMVGSTGLGRGKRILKGEFVEEHREFYLFKHPIGYKECFLKSSLEKRAINGIRIKYTYGIRRVI